MNNITRFVAVAIAASDVLDALDAKRYHREVHNVMACSCSGYPPAHTLEGALNIAHTKTDTHKGKKSVGEQKEKL